MKSISIHHGKVAPLDRSNVDTDVIIPKQFLKSIKRTGFGKNLFDQLRYMDEGKPDEDCSNRKLKTEFVLNLPRYKGVSILLTRSNFGCGSSREHAPWALLDFGFRCILASSYADIFYNNCFKNGILPIELSEDILDYLFVETEKNIGYELTVDLPNEKILCANGRELTFNIDPFRKDCLLKGLDEIGMTLKNFEEIKRFEKVHYKKSPWLFESA